jgi:hypothetical protein
MGFGSGENQSIFEMPSMRRVFHWYPAVTIPFIWGAGGYMIQLDKFGLAYCFFILAAVWSVGCWLTSNSLRHRRRLLRLRKNKQSSEILRHLTITYQLWKWGVVVGIVVLLCLSVWLVSNMELTKELQAFSGRLIPACDPTPINPCDPVPPDYLTVFLGNNATATNNFPHTVLEVAGSPVISLDRSADGSIAVILTIRSQDNNVVVSMDKSGFVVNERNQLKFKRSDRNTLTVMDQQEKQWLYARYLNPYSFKLDGMIGIPGRGFIPLQLLAGMDRSCAMSLNGIDISIK